MPATPCLTSDQPGWPHRSPPYEREMEGLKAERKELKALVEEEVVSSGFAISDLEGKKYLWNTYYI